MRGHICKKEVHKNSKLVLDKLANMGTYGTQYAQPLALAEWELVGEVHKDFCQSPATYRSEQQGTVVIIKRKGFKNISQLQ